MNWSGRALHSQVMVVTGASSGIGLCTVLSAVERGCKVLAIARSEATLDNVVHKIRKWGGKAVAFPGDVADGARMQLAAEHAVEKFGRIDTWINCAGVSILGRMEDILTGDSHRLFDTNFWGVVNGSLAAMPYLRANGGALVNLGCDLTATDPSMRGMYAVSKHAVKAFTRSLREELRRHGESSLSISLIEPVSVDTPFMQHARNYLDSEPESSSYTIPPSRVAEAILEAAVHGGDEIRVDVVPTLVRRDSDRFLPPRQLYAERGEDIVSADEAKRAISPSGALYRPCHSGRIRSQKRRSTKNAESANKNK
jgi:NAD(P)-dependent dehydrogenase (short-subunit alcohol dehydrogenase family)